MKCRSLFMIPGAGNFLREKWGQVLEHSQFNAKAQMNEIP